MKEDGLDLRNKFLMFLKLFDFKYLKVLLSRKLIN